MKLYTSIDSKHIVINDLFKETYIARIAKRSWENYRYRKNLHTSDYGVIDCRKVSGKIHDKFRHIKIEEKIKDPFK